MFKCLIDLSHYQGDSPDNFFSDNYKVFSSPFLESFKLSTDTKTMLVIREISSNFLNGTSDQLSLDDDAYEEAKNTLKEYPLAIQFIEFNNTSKALHIYNGEYNPAPLYYHEDGAQYIFSWDPNDFLRNLNLKDLDKQYCRNFLLDNISYGQSTLFSSLKKIPAGCTLSIHGQKESLSLPVEKKPYIGREVSDIDIYEEFESILKQTLSRWPITQIKIACEYSGGLDSTMTSCLAHEILGNEDLKTYGLHINNEGKEQQIDRREEAIALFSFDDLFIEIEDHLPYSKILGENQGHEFLWPMSELYFEAMIPFLKDAQQHNIQGIMTGIGGDELTFLFDHEKKHLNIQPQKSSPPLPDFVWKDADLMTENIWPNQQISESTRQAIEARAKIFMKHGLWHINPLAMPEIIEFTRQLPIKYRHNRQVFKEVLRKKGLSEEYLNPKYKENFSEVFPHAFNKYEKEIRAIAANMLLAEIDIIDGKKFLSSLNDYYDNQDPKHLFPLIKTLHLELFLRHNFKP